MEGVTAWPGSADLAAAAALLSDRLPAGLGPLAEIAMNYRWSWLAAGPGVFEALDAHRWEICGKNPVHLLEEVREDVIQSASRDPAYVRRAEAVRDAVRNDLARRPAPGWDPQHPIAYLCAEFGLHCSLPIYAGGLGALAGDILKECSDRAIPAIGIGLMYRQGYLHQRIDGEGRQHEYWTITDPERLPGALVTDGNGNPILVEVEVAHRKVVAQVWRIDIGRVPLYLFDSERPENDRLDRWITSRLYVGDHATRLAQYVLLGVGAVRLLRVLGIEPMSIHLNEGHAALAALELVRQFMAAGDDLARAEARARQLVTFTTHTPVAAGNEYYRLGEVTELLSGTLDLPGLGSAPAVDLGRYRAGEGDFGLAPIGLRLSRGANGVSKRHAEVAQEMWRGLQPGRPEDAPITAITNGVHVPTWMAAPMRDLLDRYLGSGWADCAADPATWAPISSIPDSELWDVRRAQRRRLVDYVRARSTADRLARGDPGWFVEAAARTFDPDTLTIGFARRIASYKRLHLLVHDSGRALGLISRGGLQILLAGKAHPQDEQAKAIVQQLFALKWAEHVGASVCYLEDYDLDMAAELVAGCDVWLNLPRPPQEASGTSGMKSVLNGGLHLSVLDGWWAEAFDGENGWAISSPVGDDAAQDAADAGTLYRLMEQDVLPIFYERDEHGLPRRWIARIKHSMTSLAARFSASRMVGDYERALWQIPAATQP